MLHTLLGRLLQQLIEMPGSQFRKALRVSKQPLPDGNVEDFREVVDELGKCPLQEKSQHLVTDRVALGLDPGG